MADVTIPVQTVDRDGVAENFTALNDVDVYHVRLGEGLILHFKNTGASPSTVTMVTPGNVGGLGIDDATLSVPATSGDVLATPAPRGVFADSAGELQFTQDQASGVTVAAVRAE